MSSCYICGSNIDQPVLDSRDMKTKPCGTCESVIQESIDQMEARDARKEKSTLDDIEVIDEEYTSFDETPLDNYNNQGYSSDDDEPFQF